MNKPPKDEVVKLCSDLKKSCEDLQIIRTSIAMTTREIKTIYSSIKKRAVLEELSVIPIEDINIDGEGINVSALKAVSINHLSDVLDKSLTELKNIDGIGDVMASKIHSIAKDSKRQIENTYGLSTGDIDLDNSEVRKFIEDIYLMINTTELRNVIENLYHSKVTVIEDNLEEASKVNAFGWFLVKKPDKERRLNSYRRLTEISESGFVQDVSDTIAQFNKCKEESDYKRAGEAYLLNTAPFFAMIEKLCGKNSVKDESSVLGIPEDVIKAINDFELDTGLMNSVLRGYQEFGTKYILNQQRVLLGDEMGLGKTIQAIAAMAHLCAAGATHFIVVCPVSVMVNWEREIEKHSKLKATRIHGDKREEEFLSFIENGGVAVTTYETIVKLPLENLTHNDFLVVDEAHYVKNPSAQRTKALSRLTASSDYVLLMTGTPLENKVEEMVFLISLLRENLSKELGTMLTISKASQFREKIAPVYLRRVREDVLSELPEKIETEEWCELTGSEKKAYIEALTLGSISACRKVSFSVDNDEDSSKLVRLLELCNEAKEDGRKIVIFSFYLSIIERVSKALGESFFGVITGSIPSEERQRIIDDFAQSEAGSVIVSQITAGGVGLNIQCASVVIICEPQWKPSVENQAISRCYRMGQANTVLVYRLLSSKTVDEKINNLLADKTKVFDSFADESQIDEINKQMMERIIEEERAAYGINDDQIISE